MEYCCTSRTYVVWLVCDLVESTVHPVLFGPMLDWTYLWKSTVRPVYFMKITYVCIFRKSTVRPVFFLKSTVCPVFVRYVVSSVYVQEKYRTSGIFSENYRMSGICWVCGV